MPYFDKTDLVEDTVSSGSFFDPADLVGEDKPSEVDPVDAGSADKKRIGVFASTRLKAQKATGNTYDDGALDTTRAVAESVLPFAGKLRNIKSNEQMTALDKLSKYAIPEPVRGKNGISVDPTKTFSATRADNKSQAEVELDSIAAHAGFDEEDFKYAQEQSGGDVRKKAEIFRSLADSALKQRIENKTSANNELASSEQGTLAKVGSGIIDNAGYTAEFAIGGAIGGAAKLAVPAIASAANRMSDLSSKDYSLDENGRVVAKDNADSQGAAIGKASTGAAIETGVEIGTDAALKWAFGPLGKALSKPVNQATRGVVKSLSKSVTGRVVLGTAKAYQKAAEITAVNGLGSEMIENYLQDTADELGGFGKKTSEYKGIGQEAEDYGKKFFSTKYHSDMFLSMLGTMALQGGAASAKQYVAESAVNADKEGFLKARGLEDADLKKLSATDKDYLHRIFSNPEMTPERAQRALRTFGDKVGAAAKKITDQEGYDFYAKQEGIEPNFKLPPVAPKDNEIVTDEVSGLGVVRYSDGRAAIFDRDGKEAGQFGTLKEAVDAAKQLSVRNQAMDVRREQKVTYIAGVAKRLAGKSNIKIHNTVEDMIADTPDIANDQNYSPESTGVNHKGVTHIVLDNIQNPNDAVSVILHDVGAHQGLRNVLSKPGELQKFLGNLSSDEVSKYKEWVSKNGYTGTDVVPEEALAYMFGSRSVNPTGYQKAVSWLHAQLRKVNPNYNFTDSDIAVMMSDAQKSVQGEGGSFELGTPRDTTADREQAAYDVQRSAQESAYAPVEKPAETQQLKADVVEPVKSPVDLAKVDEANRNTDPQMWTEAMRAARNDIELADRIFSKWRGEDVKDELDNGTTFEGMNQQESSPNVQYQGNQRLRRGILADGMTPADVEDNPYRNENTDTTGRKPRRVDAAPDDNRDAFGKPKEPTDAEVSAREMMRGDRLQRRMDQLSEQSKSAPKFNPIVSVNRVSGKIAQILKDRWNDMGTEERRTMFDLRDGLNRQNASTVNDALDMFVLDLDTRPSADAQQPSQEAPQSLPAEPVTSEPVVAEKPVETPTATPIDKARQFKERIKDKYPVRNVSVPNLLVNVPGLEQFKEDADPVTGEVEGQKLSGAPLSLAENPIVVMELKDGREVIVTGRHRYGLYKRNNVSEIPAHIIKESDGWTLEDASVLDAFLNILDEKGTINDYVKFFDSTNPTREEVDGDGLTSRPKGQAAWSLFKDAGTDLRAATDFTGRREDGIRPEQAAVIAKEAPVGADKKNAALQRIGIKKALSGAKEKYLESYMRSVVRNSKNVSESTNGQALQDDWLDGMLGASLMEDSDKETAAINKKIAEYTNDRAILSNAVNKPDSLRLTKEKAAEYGIKNLKDPKQIKAAYEAAKMRVQEWSSLTISSELINQARQEAGLPVNVKPDLVSQVASPAPVDKVNPVVEPKNDGELFGGKVMPFNLDGGTQEDVVRIAAEKKADEDRQAEANRKLDSAPVLPGIDSPIVKESLTVEKATQNVASATPNVSPKRGTKVATTRNADGVSYFGEVLQSNPDGTVKIRAFKEKTKGTIGAKGYGVDSKGNQVTKDVDVPAESVKSVDATADTSKMTDEERRKLKMAEKIDAANSDNELRKGSVEAPKDLVDSFNSAKERKEQRKTDNGSRFMKPMTGAPAGVNTPRIKPKTTPSGAQSRYVRAYPSVEDESRRREMAVELAYENGLTPRTIAEMEEKGRAKYDSDAQMTEMDLLTGRLNSDKPEDMAAARVATDELNLKANNSTDPNVEATAILGTWRWYEKGTQVARSLRMRFDKLDTPESRLVWLSRALRTPTAEERAMLSKTQGVEAQVKALKPAAERARKILKALRDIKVRFDKEGKEIDLDFTHFTNEQLMDNTLMNQTLVAISTQSASLGDKVLEYWRNSILSGPATQIVNFGGNVGHAVLEAGVQRNVEAFLNMFVKSADAPTRNSVGAMYANILPFVDQAKKNFVESWKSERPVTGPGASKLEEANAAIPGKAGKIIRIPQRLMTSTDEFCKTVFMGMMTADYATREFDALMKAGKLKESDRNAFMAASLDPASKAYGKAWQETLRWSFQSEPGVFVKALSMVRREPGPLGFMMKFVFPFLKTPANIIATSVRKSPAGLANMLYRAGKGQYTGSPENNALFVRHASEQIIAMTMLALIMDLAEPDEDDKFKRPLITGTKKTIGVSQGQRENDTRNYPSTSFRIGNKWFNYGRLEPFATMISTMVDVSSAWQEHKNGRDGDIPGIVFNSLASNIRDKTFLQTMGDIIDAFQEGGEQKFALIIQRVASGFSPNLVRSVSRAFDPYIRDMRNSDSGMKWLKTSVVRLGQMALPVPQLQPEPRKDVYGRNVEKEGGVLYNILSPFRMQDGEKITKVDVLLKKWNDAQPKDDRWYPAPPNNPKIKILGTKNEIKLTPEEFSEYQKIAGESAAKRLATMYFNYDKPTEKDIDRIRDVFTESRDMARSRIRPKVIARAFKERGKNG